MLTTDCASMGLSGVVPPDLAPSLAFFAELAPEPPDGVKVTEGCLAMNLPLFDPPKAEVIVVVPKV